MKKRFFPLMKLVFRIVLFFSGLFPAHAQLSDPAAWTTFINSADNRLVSDTFRIQTFGDSLEDNWEYRASGNTAVADISSENKDDLNGVRALTLRMGCSVSFEPFSPSIYQNIYMRIFFGGDGLMKNENLNVKVYRPNEVKNASLSTVTSNYARCPYSATRIKDNPYALDLQTSDPASNTQNGYYALQYLLAYGEIPEYSLFEGKGDWNDTLRWSHLPAQRNRKALLTGEITLSSAIRCNDVFLSNGNLHITDAGKAIFHTLTLFSTDASQSDTGYSVKVDGELTIQDRITIRKTFPETGKWYFISFPFDVYPSGIDDRFLQKDDAPNAGGNFLYVHIYNGDKRAWGNTGTGNWEVMPALPPTSDRPLFEKGKGYLVALDEKASDRTLSFTSRPGHLPESFGKDKNIPVFASAGTTATEENHRGWYLCGNPLPRPLSLSELEPNEDLDGSVYLYDGTGYTAYPIGSDYVLPPMSAFFVKASADTDLKIKENYPVKSGRQIPNFYPLGTQRKEPVASSATAIPRLTSPQINWSVTGNELSLDPLPEACILRIVNLQGVTVWKRKVLPGVTYRFSLPVKPGVYVMEIGMRGMRMGKKIRIGG